MKVFCLDSDLVNLLEFEKEISTDHQLDFGMEQAMVLGLVNL